MLDPFPGSIGETRCPDFSHLSQKGGPTEFFSCNNVPLCGKLGHTAWVAAEAPEMTAVDALDGAQQWPSGPPGFQS